VQPRGGSNEARHSLPRIRSARRRALFAPQSLPNALRTARVRRGPTQNALAKKLGLTSHEISQIERGVVDLHFSELQEVSRLLDLELVLIPRQQTAAVAALQAGSAAGLKRPVCSVGVDNIDGDGTRLEEKCAYLRNAAPRRR